MLAKTATKNDPPPTPEAGDMDATCTSMWMSECATEAPMDMLFRKLEDPSLNAAWIPACNDSIFCHVRFKSGLSTEICLSVLL